MKSSGLAPVPLLNFCSSSIQYSPLMRTLSILMKGNLEVTLPLLVIWIGSAANSEWRCHMPICSLHKVQYFRVQASCRQSEDGEVERFRS
jgi:hypothetical protein